MNREDSQSSNISSKMRNRFAGGQAARLLRKNSEFGEIVNKHDFKSNAKSGSLVADTHENLFRKVHLQTSSPSESFASGDEGDDQDSMAQMNRDEISRLKKDVRRYREAIHRQR